MSNVTVRKDHEIPEVNPTDVRFMGLKNAGGTQGDESLAGVLFENLADELRKKLIIGSPKYWAGNEADLPTGIVKCDGTLYSKAAYPKAALIFGNKYGGDATNFRVPNIPTKIVDAFNLLGVDEQATASNLYDKIWKAAVIAPKVYVPSPFQPKDWIELNLSGVTGADANASHTYYFEGFTGSLSWLNGTPINVEQGSFRISAVVANSNGITDAFEYNNSDAGNTDMDTARLKSDDYYASSSEEVGTEFTVVASNNDQVYDRLIPVGITLVAGDKYTITEIDDPRLSSINGQELTCFDDSGTLYLAMPNDYTLPETSMVSIATQLDAISSANDGNIDRLLVQGLTLEEGKNYTFDNIGNSILSPINNVSLSVGNDNGSLYLILPFNYVTQEVTGLTGSFNVQHIGFDHFSGAIVEEFNQAFLGETRKNLKSKEFK